MKKIFHLFACGLKNRCIFAAFEPRTYLTFYVAVFFIATFLAKAGNNTGYQIPAVYCTEMSVNVLGRTGGDSLSVCSNKSNFCTRMPRTTKICKDANNVSIATPTGAKSAHSKAGKAKPIKLYYVRMDMLEGAERRYYGNILYNNIYSAVSPEEAIGKCVLFLKDKYATHNIVPDSIKVELLSKTSEILHKLMTS